MNAPLNWIKEISHTLIAAKEIPLSGFLPQFPWEKLSQKMTTALQLPEIKISQGQTQFLAGGEITAGLGMGWVAIALDMTPLNGQLFWLMGKEDIAKLTTLALFSHSANKGFSSSKFQEGFYYFLATKAVHAIDELKAFRDLAPKMGKLSALPQEEALCIDIEIQHPQQTFWGRLVCPSSFHQRFKAHFNTEVPIELDSPLAKQIDVQLRLEVGQTALSLSEWKAVSIGDFLLLDQCSYDPATRKGTVLLTLHQTPLLRARIKENSLKIADYAFYHEEQDLMNPDSTRDEQNPEDFDTEELLPSEKESDLDEEENHLWSPENVPLEKMIPTKEIPLTLTVEVARLQMNLDKLLQLSPGNILELPVKPEQGVDLTIAGKKVAKAELIKLGEMLGVKILQIGE